MSILELVDEVAALLEAALPGARVVTSPMEMNPPCILVGAPSPIQAVYALGSEPTVSAEIPVEVIGRGLTRRDLDWVWETVPVAMAAISAPEASATVYRMSDGRELPAYTLITEGST